ncbi:MULTISPECIES: response regulator transcription factor [unclassified Legionella]|uniref:response regulator transcription factor n=1 Tax=unclassified Legionella TaxID=2622702 RepID=UPI0010552F29|nr:MULTISPECIES: response regulator transcription factor [unclassified Legionella]MDI9818766.1 response regulator transcription factor [Legionella sp. PL877]
MSSHRKYLLIIDDAPVEGQVIEYFSNFDYDLVQQSDFSLLGTESEPPAAVLINGALVQANQSIIVNLYQRYPVPLIIISDRADENMCVQMLEAGADDFLVKPLHPRELHARLSAITRRVQRATKDAELEKEVLLFANWRLYPASRQVFDDMTHEELQLSAGEYELLLAFVQQPQRVLGREYLLQLTKNSDLTPFDRRIDVQISRLRQKIETDAKKPALIKTIRNGGYLFTAHVLTLKEANKIS